MNQATRSALLGAAAALAALLPGAASAQFFYGYGQSYGGYGYGRINGSDGSYGNYNSQRVGNQRFTNYNLNYGGYQQNIRCTTHYFSSQAISNCY